LGGQFDYADTAGLHNLVFSTYVNPALAYNPSLVSPSEVRSYRDLLNPKWKGRIAMYDPRAAGAGLATVTFLYATPELGRDYLDQLMTQELVFSRDDRQVLDWVVRGQRAMAMAPGLHVAADMRSKGIAIEFLGAENIQEGTYVSAGVGSVGVVNRNPHPNATRVYLDWLLSYDGQLAFSRAAQYVSRRLDVPTDHLPSHMVPKPGVSYQENYKEQYVDLKYDVQEFLRTAIRS
jgi:iron(III) transport system substrate-binding protein